MNDSFSTVRFFFSFLRWGPKPAGHYHPSTQPKWSQIEMFRRSEKKKRKKKWIKANGRRTVCVHKTRTERTIPPVYILSQWLRHCSDGRRSWNFPTHTRSDRKIQFFSGVSSKKERKKKKKTRPPSCLLFYIFSPWTGVNERKGFVTGAKLDSSSSFSLLRLPVGRAEREKGTRWGRRKRELTWQLFVIASYTRRLCFFPLFFVCRKNNNPVSRNPNQK